MGIISIMKRLLLSHFLINVYLLAIIQPMYPVMEYLINYDYIVNQLCENRDKPVLACNGKCYLGKQVKESQETRKDPNRPLPPSVDFEKLLTTSPDEFSYLLREPEETNPTPGFRSKEPPLVFYDLLLRPPIS